MRIFISQVLIFFCLLFTIPVYAQLPNTVFIEELTWTELRDLIQSGKTTIIIPIGGTEQNGPDMALGKHNVRVKALSEKIARKLGNALVAPVIAYVPEGEITPPTQHMRFPGTITLPDAPFEKMLEYAARSFKLHGFLNIVFLGDHGSYQKDEKLVANQLNQEWEKSSVRVHALPEYYQTAELTYAQALNAKGYSNAEIGTHAGLSDTSLMLAIDPHLVRVENLTTDKLSAATGVYGNPQHANAALGQIGIDLIVNNTTAAIQKATARSPHVTRMSQ